MEKKPIMNRILKINKKDIIFDFSAASDMLNKFINRTKHSKVSGAFVTYDNIIFVVEDYEIPTTNHEYIIAPIEDITEDGIIAEIQSRHDCGFSTISCFEIDNKQWGVFEQSRKNT